MPLKDYCFDGKKTLRIREMPTDAGEYKLQKAELTARTEQNLIRAAELQEKLYASKSEGLVIALQARDAAGKDSLIKKVFSRLNPAAMRVKSFKGPNPTDLGHDYLWRIVRAMPERGCIGIFNRSHYEDVLAVKVHQLQNGYNIAPRCITEDFFERRYRQLNDWERYLWENGFRMIKIYLNVSKEEQKQRFLDRVELRLQGVTYLKKREKRRRDGVEHLFGEKPQKKERRQLRFRTLPRDRLAGVKGPQGEMILLEKRRHSESASPLWLQKLCRPFGTMLLFVPKKEAKKVHGLLWGYVSGANPRFEDVD